eukprot:TRINITY_DN12044_c0_g1_i2.p1 TRINITY_DN12044_c0_g1~~TRINITY_DN12044_c0_g1_i2.p1  ORF type:complete len:164 (-),score=15.19 TRINITY_DN12044_c0_g1_i2:84-575(-)
MTMGWCLLYVGYWTFYQASGDQDRVGGGMTMRILMALIFSAVTFAAIIILDRLADGSSPRVAKCYRHLLIVFSLLMGLSWEAAFAYAVEGISGVIITPETDAGICTSALMNALLSTTLSAVVLPAWAWYILVNTSECQKEHGEHHGDSAHKHAEHGEDEKVAA